MRLYTMCPDLTTVSDISVCANEHVPYTLNLKSFKQQDKSMKRVLFLAAIAVTLFSACSKNEKNITDPIAVNGFNINSGDPIDTRFGFRANWNPITEGGTFVVSSVNINDPAFTGKITGVLMEIETFVDGQTYKYMAKEDAAYDKTKNFSVAPTGLDVDFQNGTFVSGTGTQLSELRSGSVSVKKSSDNTYSLKYILDYSDAVITGTFTGPMPEVNK